MSTVTKVIKVYPPAAVREVCEFPSMGSGADFLETATNGDLVNAYLDWKESAKQCAAKIMRLNQWYNATDGSSDNGKEGGKR